MSKQQEPAAATPPEAPAPRAPSGREPIAVRLIKFSPGEEQDIPGLHSSGLTSRLYEKGKAARSRHELEYHPWMRHHRVTFFPDSGEPIVCMVHESRVARWEPLDQPA